MRTWWTAVGVMAVIVVIGSVSVHRAFEPKTATKVATSRPTSATPAPVDPATLVALNDGKVVTDAPKMGSVYTCQAPVADTVAAPKWIVDGKLNPAAKAAVKGDMAWSNASAAVKLEKSKRTVTANGLPTTHNTGEFAGDLALKPQSIELSLAAAPKVASKASCLGNGPIGVMTNGVYLYSAVNASGQDAVAREQEDACNGRSLNGRYYYRSLSSCAKEAASDQVVGYSLDGFGITGPKQPDGKVLTSADLDECHGTTSEIMWDGKKKTMYHYVMTADFPHSIGCFRGTAVSAQ